MQNIQDNVLAESVLTGFVPNRNKCVPWLITFVSPAEQKRSRISKEFFQLNFYVFFIVAVILLLLLLKAVTGGCSVEKSILGDFADFMGEHQCWNLFSIKLQAW